jgi:hypothetical protein
VLIALEVLFTILGAATIELLAFIDPGRLLDNTERFEIDLWIAPREVVLTCFFYLIAAREVYFLSWVVIPDAIFG